MIFVRSPYNYDTDAASELSGLVCPEPTLTQQQFLEESNINTIAERFGLTGMLPVNQRAPQYGDFCGVNDFQSAMNAIRRAEESFMAMPALVRERFGHDPQQFLAFCEDPNNLEEARKLGLVTGGPRIPPQEPAPAPPPQAN